MNPTLLSKKMKFKGEFFKIFSTKVKLTDKKIVNWHTIEWIHDSTAVVPVDDKNNVYFSKEWRSSWERKIMVIPVGGIRSTKEDKIEKQAHNELREEIGFDAKKFEKLVTILDAAKVKHKIHIYLATGLFKSPKRANADEIIEVVKMPIKKAYESFISGKIETTGYTMLGIILAMKKLKVK